MSTLAQKAKAIVKSLRLTEKCSLTPQETEALILLALTEQDCDTRQACADAIGKIPGQTGDDLIDAGVAMAACMNVNVI